MKRIVVCCDGTWNSPDKTDAGVPLATNVVKLAEALPSEANGMEQRVYYDAGVGTAGSRARRLFDGAAQIIMITLERSAFSCSLVTKSFVSRWSVYG